MTSPVAQRLRASWRTVADAGAEPLWPDPRVEETTVFRDAAVLIAFTDRPDPGILLLHRPTHMRAHPGQVAFPGGRLDPGEDPVTAALREAEEELGIDPAQVTVIGSGDVYRTGSGYAVTPVIAAVPADLAITPNPAEVSRWFEAPADYVLDPANRAVKTWDRGGTPARFLEIHWDGHRIWGVTAAIIANLASRLTWNA